MAARKVTSANAQTADSKETVATVKKPVKHEPNELIMCRSVFPGRFLYKGDKTHMVYLFAQKGDVTYIEYQDLLASLVTKNTAITAPYIVIEDEDLLKEAHWNVLETLYNKSFSLDNIEGLLMLPTVDFKKEFENLTMGAKRSVMLVASDMVKSKKLDSINKLSLIDEACGSNLMVLAGRD